MNEQLKRFYPLRKYSMDEIVEISEQNPTVTHLSYATVYSVLCGGAQYDFILFAFCNCDSFVLIAIDGDIPRED